MEASCARDYSDLGRMLLKLQTVNFCSQWWLEKYAIHVSISSANFRFTIQAPEILLQSVSKYSALLALHMEDFLCMELVCILRLYFKS